MPGYVRTLRWRRNKAKITLHKLGELVTCWVVLRRGRESRWCVCRKRLLKGNKREKIWLIYSENLKGDDREEAAVRLCCQLHWGLAAALQFLSLYWDVQRRKNKFSCFIFSEKNPKNPKTEIIEILKTVHSLNKNIKLLKYSMFCKDSV